MTQQETNKSVFKRWLAALDAHDKTAWFAATHPEHAQKANVDAIGDEVMLNREEHWQMVLDLESKMRLLHIPQALYADGDTVIAKGTGYCQHRNDGSYGVMTFVIIAQMKDNLVLSVESIGTAIRPLDKLPQGLQFPHID